MSKSQFLTARIIRLYRAMPGAPMPPMVGGNFMWGDVEGTEHWNFCAEIIAAIDASFDAGRGGAQ